MAVVVVAIPEEQDPVWKYSSEKIPHMTLLYLDDSIADDSTAVEYIQHAAATTLPRFYMSVDKRGTLGADEADVLFFRINRWEKDVEEFRGYLLKNDTIKKAYDSVEQFPEWTPHLTMGYPASPAKKDDRDYPGFGSVHFDRVALWTEDYDGPTFQLDENRWDGPEVAMGEVSKFLAHYGVLGQKWGVRRERSRAVNGPGIRETRAAAKEANEFLKNTPSGETRAAHIPGQRIKTAGGKNLPVHPDAVRAAKSRQKVKASTLDALSDADLQHLVNRANLENQYSKLVDPKNKKNQGYLKSGMETLNQVMKAKKTYDTLMKDEFVNSAVNGLKEDLGINDLIRKGAGGAAKKVFGG